MLAFPRIVAALLAGLPGLAHPAEPAAQDLAFQVIWPAEPGEWISFVHVESDPPHPALPRLGVYSDRGQLAIWPDRGEGVLPRPFQLEPEERFALSEDRHLLGILRYPFDCDVFPGLTRQTELRFPDGLFPPPVPPPVVLAGACRVHVSDSGELLVCTQIGAADNKPTQVVVYGLESGPPARFVQVGSYTNLGQGIVSTSRIVRLIAQGEGPSIRILDQTGEEQGRVAGGAGFALAPSGSFLGVVGQRSVAIHGLGAGGRPVERVVTPLESQPGGVKFALGQALVHCRDHLTLVDAASGEAAWTVESSAGTYSCADLAPWASGELCVVAGRLQVLRAPARLDGEHKAGRARVYVDVLTQTGQPIATTSFLTDRWNHRSPRVLLLPQARRVVLHTGDKAYLSGRIP
jgi:hypothetical protein